jgi:large subunit ribosomal protein L5e
MGFVKVLKNKAYFKRYQVKFKRRRECKTDYYARQRLILQDKNKFKSPKYRFVVRFTNKDIVCQIFSSDLDHDVCLGSAYAHELSRYGIKVGLTNFAAAYCTGLLLARRVNKKLGLDSVYEGAEASVENFESQYEDGAYAAEQEGDKKPFYCLLDVGLARTTTGSRIFGALKGACDGGLEIPHNNRRFPGSKKDEDGEYQVDLDVQRSYIFGGHIKNYMEQLSEKEEDYKRQFAKYIAAGVSADDLEDMYTKAHAAIRASPNAVRATTQLGRFKERKGAKSTVKKSYKVARLTREERADKVRQTLLAMGKTSLAQWTEQSAEAAPAAVEAAVEEDSDDDMDLL